MYHRHTVNPTLDLLHSLRQHRSRFSCYSFERDRLYELRAALQFYRATTCGCDAVLSYDPDFELTDFEIRTCSYDYLLGRLETIINALDYITRQPENHNHYHREMTVSQGPRMFGRTVFNAPNQTTHTHSSQHQHSSLHQHSSQHHNSQSVFFGAGTTSQTQFHAGPHGPSHGRGHG